LAAIHFRPQPFGLLPCRFAQEPLTTARPHIRSNLLSDAFIKSANAFVAQIANITHAKTSKKICAQAEFIEQAVASG
jgi:hypothetical protein